MSNAGGNNDAGTITEYERQKLANVERNKRRLEALNIPRLDTMVQPVRPKKMSKKTHTTNNATTEPHNLRPRTQRNIALAEQQLSADIQAADDFLAEYEDRHSGDQNNGTPKKKKGGRGVTRKEDIFARTPDMPKIPILLNDRGQAVGKHGRKFSSALGCQVRKKLSVGCHYWRLVDAEKKYALWKDLKAIYDLDDDAFDWFMRTAGRKWKEFKATLKKLYFKPNVEYTDQEVSQSRDKRVNDADWKFLFTYWMSAESKARARKAKANRAKLQVPHTLGSLSYACSEHDLNKLKKIVEEHPELKDKTIQEGDAFAAVCGEKEPKGYVRVWGLGPTPQDVGTPGLKCYTPTRLQMEIFARKKAEKEKMALQKRVDQLLSQMDQREQMAHQDRTSAEPMSQNGSTSRLHVNAMLDQTFMGEEDEPEEDYDAGDDDLYNEGYQNLPGQVHDTAPSKHANHITTTPTSNAGARYEHDGARSEHDDRVGKEAILYAMISRSDQPVAKGTIISTKPSTIVAGQCIGSQFCEVIVTHVLKRDAILPRPYLDMNTMGDAKMMGIAWPYRKLKICNKEATPPTSGCIGR